MEWLIHKCNEREMLINESLIKLFFDQIEMLVNESFFTIEEARANAFEGVFVWEYYARLNKGDKDASR